LFLRVFGLPLLLLVLAAFAAPGPATASEVRSDGVQKLLMPGPQAQTLARYGRHSTPNAQWFSSAFRTRSGHDVSIRFALPPAAGLASMQEFGISDPEVDALLAGCRRDRTCSQDQYQQRLVQYYRDHKLRLRAGPEGRYRLSVDVPEVVRAHRAGVLPVVGALQRWAASEDRGTDQMFEAATALVQSGLAYRTPAAIDVGRKTLGFYTPPRTLEKGYGDCDTKSALLAAILENLGGARMIGVRVPNHYLLGIEQAPRAGQAYVEYQGRAFVLLEAAGPAIRPVGQVSDQTQVAMATGLPMRIDPMF
jgi:hypothetical protein